MTDELTSARGAEDHRSELNALLIDNLNVLAAEKSSASWILASGQGVGTPLKS